MEPVRQGFFLIFIQNIFVVCWVEMLLHKPLCKIGEIVPAGNVLESGQVGPPQTETLGGPQQYENSPPHTIVQSFSNGTGQQNR
jgi:hypothetical protein